MTDTPELPGTCHSVKINKFNLVFIKTSGLLLTHLYDWLKGEKTSLQLTTESTLNTIRLLFLCILTT